MNLLRGVNRSGEFAGRTRVFRLQLRLAGGCALLHRGEGRGGVRGGFRGRLACFAELLEVNGLALLRLLLVFVRLLLEFALHNLSPLGGDFLLLALDLISKVILEHVERLILGVHHLRPERVHLSLRLLGGSLGGGAELLDARGGVRGGRLQVCNLRSEIRGERLRFGS